MQTLLKNHESPTNYTAAHEDLWKCSWRESGWSVLLQTVVGVFCLPHCDSGHFAQDIAQPYKLGDAQGQGALGAVEIEVWGIVRPTGRVSPR